MSTKAAHKKSVEGKVNAVFSQRAVKYKSYNSSKRVPKQDHYATTIQKGSTKKG